jgi:hypothetical protein
MLDVRHRVFGNPYSKRQGGILAGATASSRLNFRYCCAAQQEAQVFLADFLLLAEMLCCSAAQLTERWSQNNDAHRGG